MRRAVSDSRSCSPGVWNACDCARLPFSAHWSSDCLLVFTGRRPIKETFWIIVALVRDNLQHKAKLRVCSDAAKVFLCLFHVIRVRLTSSVPTEITYRTLRYFSLKQTFLWRNSWKNIHLSQEKTTAKTCSTSNPQTNKKKLTPNVIYGYLMTIQNDSNEEGGFFFLNSKCVRSHMLLLLSL